MRNFVSAGTSVRLDEITKPRRARVAPSAHEGLPFVGLENIDSGTGKLCGVQDVSKIRSSVRVFRSGDLLYGGILPSLNKLYIAEFDGVASAEFIILPPQNGVNQRFLQIVMQRQDFVTFATQRSSGSRSRVKFEDIGKYRIFIPTIYEQDEIVQKIDLFEQHRDDIKGNLNDAFQLIKRFKILLLEEAFCKSHSRSCRDQKSWQIPESWVWKRVADIGDIRLGKTKSPDSFQGKHMRPYLRSANITWKGLKLDDINEMNFEPNDFDKFELNYGDVILNEGSGSSSEVGKPAIWRNEIPNCCFQNHILRVRPAECTSEFLYWYLLLVALTGGFVSDSKGIGIQHIGKRGLSDFPIPIPPKRDQIRVVKRISDSFSKIDKATDIMSSSSCLIDLLHSKILDTELSEQRSM